MLKQIVDSTIVKLEPQVPFGRCHVSQITRRVMIMSYLNGMVFSRQIIDLVKVADVK